MACGGMACGGTAGAGAAGATGDGAAVLGEDESAGACAPAGIDKARRATTAVAFIKWFIMVADLRLGPATTVTAAPVSSNEITNRFLLRSRKANASLQMSFVAPLPGTPRRATKGGMRVLVRRFVLLLAMLAFGAGLPLALAVPPALAADPCPHEHHDEMAGRAAHQHHAPQQKQHRHDAAGCLCCCLGACVAIPDLVRGAPIAVPFSTATVVYAETAVALSGRSLRPDPAPPRTDALS